MNDLLARAAAHVERDGDRQLRVAGALRQREMGERSACARGVKGFERGGGARQHQRAGGDVGETISEMAGGVGGGGGLFVAALLLLVNDDEAGLKGAKTAERTPQATAKSPVRTRSQAAARAPSAISE